jgi:hypothetical protein
MVHLPSIKESPSQTPTTSPTAKNVRWLTPEKSLKQKASASSPGRAKHHDHAEGSESEWESSSDDEIDAILQVQKSPTTVDAEIQFGCVAYVRPQDIKHKVRK